MKTLNGYRNHPFNKHHDAIGMQSRSLYGHVIVDYPQKSRKEIQSDKQFWQTAEVLAPAIVDHVPALQLTQSRCSSATIDDVYVPAGQLTHVAGDTF